jgi:hypothetical protein
MSTEFPCECTLMHPVSEMQMPCSACSKATFILIHKVVSKTRKNKFRTEDLIGSLIGTKFLDHKTLI